MAAAAAPAHIAPRKHWLTGSVGMTQMVIDGKLDPSGSQQGSETAVAEFIRKKGITRCPTACVLPTQGEVPASDREALAEYATYRERSRQARAAQRARPFWPVELRRPDRE